jgi:hypothetical protein
MGVPQPSTKLIVQWEDEDQYCEDDLWDIFKPYGELRYVKIDESNLMQVWGRAAGWPAAD